MHHFSSSYPQSRLRRLRQAPWIRDMVAENHLSINDLILPLFLQEEKGKVPIATMPGVYRLGPDALLETVKQAYDLGIKVVALFPHVPMEKKDAQAKEAINPRNLVCESVRAIKALQPAMGIICDVALDPYNSNGHDGLVEKGEILNDATLEVLAQQALVQAKAGCDVIAPSDMMDGRVEAIRHALDQDGYQNTMILSYAAKYASYFYGPFRDAVGSKGALKGDKKTYQMDPRNGDEAIHEVAQDLGEGADMVMIKPGMAYLDIVMRISQTFQKPTFVYQVSGEYAMLKMGVANGLFDENIMLESLMAFKRAGATGILTYGALDIAKTL